MTDKRSMVVAEQAEIHVYAGDTGYIVIKQVNRMEDDDIIYIDPLHTETIIKSLIEAAKDAIKSRQEWLEEEE